MLRQPGWVDPTALWRFLGQKIASGIGGDRGAGLPEGSPKWFHLNPKHSDLVHGCATTSKNEGAEVAEVQIKSNRGVSLEVTVPGDPAYVKAGGPAARSAAVARRRAQLRPGPDGHPARLQNHGVGYEQVYTKAALVVLRHWRYLEGCDRHRHQVVDLLLSKVDPTIVVCYTEFKCERLQRGRVLGSTWGLPNGMSSPAGWMAWQANWRRPPAAAALRDRKLAPDDEVIKRLA